MGWVSLEVQPEAFTETRRGGVAYWAHSITMGQWTLLFPRGFHEQRSRSVPILKCIFRIYNKFIWFGFKNLRRWNIRDDCTVVFLWFFAVQIFFSKWVNELLKMCVHDKMQNFRSRHFLTFYFGISSFILSGYPCTVYMSCTLYRDTHKVKIGTGRVNLLLFMFTRKKLITLWRAFF